MEKSPVVAIICLIPALLAVRMSRGRIMKDRTANTQWHQREGRHNIQHTITHIKGKQMRNQCHLSDLCPTPKSSKLVQYLLSQTCKTQYKGNTAITRAPLAAINSISLQLQQTLLFSHHQTPNYRRLLTICLCQPLDLHHHHNQAPAGTRGYSLPGF